MSEKPVTLKPEGDPPIPSPEKIAADLRRDLVGALVRYMKDRETDFSKLVFHYVHLEDYGVAMIEGWGELHRLLTSGEVYGAAGEPLLAYDAHEQALMIEVLSRADESVTLDKVKEGSLRARLTYGYTYVSEDEIKAYADRIGITLAPERDDDEDDAEDRYDDEDESPDEPIF